MRPSIGVLSALFAFADRPVNRFSIVTRKRCNTVRTATVFLTGRSWFEFSLMGLKDSDFPRFASYFPNYF